MDPVVLLVFGFVYLGMILGRIPGLALDRTGVAVLGATALVVTGRVSPEEAWLSVHVPTVALLLGLMLVSAQLRLGGFYSRTARRIAAVESSPAALLGLLVAVTGALSAVLANDIVCLAVAPVMVEGCSRRGLDPVPYLLGLACASNVGSAATLIGNPQNMLIGQTLGLSFAGYLVDAAVPSVLGLVLVWAVIARTYRGRWRREPAPVPVPVEAPPYRAWPTAKGLLVAALLVATFLFLPWPREVAALAAAGLLLLSRRTASRELLRLVDWQLLLLFVGLFVVNHALAASGALEKLLSGLTGAGVDVRSPPVLFAATAGLSNLVSNVPATMLLLPAAAGARAGPVLALSSTLAGNLVIVGSIANIIVVDQAERLGIRIGWGRHARVGVPVTLATLAVAAAWLALV